MSFKKFIGDKIDRPLNTEYKQPFDKQDALYLFIDGVGILIFNTKKNTEKEIVIDETKQGIGYYRIDTRTGIWKEVIERFIQERHHKIYSYEWR